jgi:ferric-dicitrate binding protein FerR (iron transport regulator)
MSDSPVSPEDIRAAAETYRELGPEYHDAVVASFLEKVDREVAARVEARLADLTPPQPPKRRRRRAGLTRRRALRDIAAASAGALAVVGVVAAVGVQHSSSAFPDGRARVEHAFPGGPEQVIIGPQGRRVLIPQDKIPQPPAAPKPPPPPG